MTDPDLHEALTELGVSRLLFAIHGASFPADPGEDLGSGSPGTAAARRLYAHLRSLGFTGIQLGPAGETSRDNASPYDSTIFSRALASIPAACFAPGHPYAGLVSAASLAAIHGDGAERGDHRRAYDGARALIGEAWSAHIAGARPELAARLATFRNANTTWLERDALFATLHDAYGQVAPHAWVDRGADPLDATLWASDDDRRIARRAALRRDHTAAIDAYVFGQMIAHDAHAEVRRVAGSFGLALYGDLQVGMSHSDVWSHTNAFLADYVMGAPPSRTNRDGQPWNYPVLDPVQIARGGAARALFRARIEKTFSEYDSLRIDHPHGLVCPWVYRSVTPDAGAAVRAGARLFESPDLADHPDLARFALVAPEQVDRAVPRHADRWVTTLSPAQIDRFAVLFDEIVATADRHGRDRDVISCEVLSTLPLPLQAVLDRHRLGRWRVLQKANLDDPSDVYRLENAAPEDWVMLGNHDTPSIFGLVATWDATRRGRWADHVATQLVLPRRIRALLDETPTLLPSAMLAEAFACRAKNVMVFFADLFGYEERFNEPGTIGDSNWSLRLPPDFATRYRDRLARGRALNIPLALALALTARGSTSHALVTRLWEAAVAGTPLLAAGFAG